MYLNYLYGRISDIPVAKRLEYNTTYIGYDEENSTFDYLLPASHKKGSISLVATSIVDNCKENSLGIWTKYSFNFLFFKKLTNISGNNVFSLF